MTIELSTLENYAGRARVGLFGICGIGLFAALLWPSGDGPVPAATPPSIQFSNDEEIEPAADEEEVAAEPPPAADPPAPQEQHRDLAPLGNESTSAQSDSPVNAEPASDSSAAASAQQAARLPAAPHAVPDRRERSPPPSRRPTEEDRAIDDAEPTDDAESTGEQSDAQAEESGSTASAQDSEPSITAVPVMVADSVGTVVLDFESSVALSAVTQNRTVCAAVGASMAYEREGSLCVPLPSAKDMYLLRPEEIDNCGSTSRATCGTPLSNAAAEVVSQRADALAPGESARGIVTNEGVIRWNR